MYTFFIFEDDDSNSSGIDSDSEGDSKGDSEADSKQGPSFDPASLASKDNTNFT